MIQLPPSGTIHGEFHVELTYGITRCLHLLNHNFYHAEGWYEHSDHHVRYESTHHQLGVVSWKW